MRKYLVAAGAVASLALLCGAENLPIVDQNGMQTGYHVQTNENRTESALGMLQAAQALGQAQNDASIAGGLSKGLQAAEVGYLQGAELRRQEDLNAAMVKLLNAETENKTAATHTDSLVYAEAELVARMNKVLDARCKRNPKHPSCSEDRNQIPWLVDQMMIDKDLVLIPRAWWEKKN